MPLNVQTLVLPVGNLSDFTMNCYILTASADAEEVIVIDPADKVEQILAALGKRKLAAIILTHRHDDHCAATGQLVAATGAPVYAHELDAEAIENPGGRYPWFALESRPLPVVDVRLRDGEQLKLAGITLEVLHTPGHSAGSICLYSAADQVLISGDTLFYGTTGRTDLDSGSPAEMHKSLLRLSKLPDEVRIYPGHDRPTTVAAERHRALVEY